MKALILAGGRGRRLDQLSEKKNKCMIEVGGRPIIENSIQYVITTNISDIIIVVGHKAEEIINYFGTEYKGKKIKYVVQWEQEGLVHAIEYAKEVVAGDDFMLLLGDEVIIDPRHSQMIEEFNKGEVFAICGVLNVENKEYIRRTYTLIRDENDMIYRLIEKPRAPLNNIMGTGSCIFSNDIFKYIDVTPVHHERQEKELPDMIQCAIDDGKKVKMFYIGSRYANLNTEEDIDIISKLSK